MGERASAFTLASELGSDELSFLLELIRRNGRLGRHLEIGTAAGGTLCQMMNCFEPSQRPHFVVVDPMTYFPDQLVVVHRNLCQHVLDPATVEFRMAKSAAAFRHAEAVGEQYDFMFIDGAHKIRYVTQDLCWTRLLNVDGLVCLHDYDSQHKGVLWPVNRFLKRHRNYQREGLVGSLMVLRKTASSQAAEIDLADRLWATLLSPWLQSELNLKKRLSKAT